MIRVTSLSFVLVAAIGLSANGQGFINLDFESAVVQPLTSSNLCLWSVAAPGWGRSDSSSVIYYQQGHLGVDQIFLLMDSTSPVWAPGTQLAGQYSLALASGYLLNDPSSAWVDAYISQSGDVPSSAQSLRLLATGPFEVFLGGVEIPMFSLGGNSYGGHVSGFAGTTAELKIVNTASVGDVHHYSIVDNVSFSPEAVPEPSTVALFVLGASLLAWRLQRLRKS
jgi:hypothetical protein